MKRMVLILALFLGLSISVPAQKWEAQQKQDELELTSKTWVLQNPELAVIYQTMTLYANGEMLQQSTNLMTNEKGSAKSKWKFDTKTQTFTIIGADGNSYKCMILLVGNTLTTLDANDKTDCIFAKLNSENDCYMKRVKDAVEMYGTDASLKQNGFPSSSRETGYSFMPRYSPCFSCTSTGRCINCHGSGMVTYNYRDYNACPSCGGTGVCWQCHGKGKIQNY